MSADEKTGIMIRRLLEALDLMEFGVALMRQNLVRRYPGATPSEIAAKLDRWLIWQEPITHRDDRFEGR